MECIPFVFSGIFSSILSTNLLVSRRNLLIISGSLYFFRLFAISLPAVLSTHLSLSFPACPSVSPPVSLSTVQIINSCLVRQLLASLHRSTGSPVYEIKWVSFSASDFRIVFLCVGSSGKTYSCHLFLTNFIL